MNPGPWNAKTLIAGLLAGAGVVLFVAVLAVASLELEVPIDAMLPFNLAAYFVAGSAVAAVTGGGGREGGQGGLIVGFLDGTIGWIPPAMLLAGRPDLSPVALWGPEGLALDLILGGALVSMASAVLLGMLGGWVVARLRNQ